MALPNPIIERERKKHTREGFAQYLLASLILGEGPKKWNTPYQMWPCGRKIAADLCAKAFDDPAGAGDGRFYWEFRLEAPGSPGGRWPDLAIRTEDRLILFELKTEAGSIREGQVDEYLELARAQFPDLHVDMLYLTRDPVADAPFLPDRARYGNLTWADVAAILEVRSADLGDADRFVCRLFVEYLEQVLFPTEVTPEKFVDIGKPAEFDWEAADLNDGRLLEILDSVERTRSQQVMPIVVASPTEGHRICDEIRELIRGFNMASDNKIAHASSWVWTSTTKGTAKSQSGTETGVEIRISYYQKGNGLSH
jgi:hypothetical protein